MDLQFDFRALLLSIHDRLSSEDRRRLHFILGDVVPRYIREDATHSGTLNVFEALIDRAVISEEYLDFLIRIFREIGCHDAVRRLKEFQSLRKPQLVAEHRLFPELPRERAATVSDVFDDNVDEDKYVTKTYNAESNSIPMAKLDERKTTSKDSASIFPEKDNNTDKSSMSIPQKSRINLCCYGLFIFQILILLIYLWFFYRKKAVINYIEHRVHRDAYISKYGRTRNDTNGQWFDHSENLSLTFTDRLIRIDAYRYIDNIYSINFTYSNNKTKEHKLQNPTKLNKPTLQSLEFKQEKIQSITQCYKNNNGSTRLVGLLILLNNNSTLFGSCHDQIQEEDKYSNHVFGYALAKMDQYVHGFQFVWYRICLLTSQITSCVDPDHYVLDQKQFYKDR